MVFISQMYGQTDGSLLEIKFSDLPEASQFGLGPDGQVVIRKGDVLLIRTLDGQKLNDFTYAAEEGFRIANFSLFPDYIVVNAWKFEGTLIKRVLFADYDGRYLGWGYDPALDEPENIHFRNIINLDDRTFAVARREFARDKHRG